MSTAPLVAVIGAPALAKALADVGFRVASGPGFRQAATAANEALREDPRTVVVLDCEYADSAGFDAFLRALVARTRTVLIATRSKHPIVDSVPGVVSVATPVTIGDVMVSIGYQKIDHPAGLVVVEDVDAVAAPAPTLMPQPLVPVANFGG
ncbi:MAG: hypothetical protein V4737_10870 [Curtobacterium sp.]